MIYIAIDLENYILLKLGMAEILYSFKISIVVFHG